ncbi:MAG: hypothetical protein GF421_05735 [Candidatus Aminicenantes bacterium]|nr:hypothetical protein [Candidatus Aminicenantes bacterium]
MVVILTVFFSLLIPPQPPVSKKIERAFLQNNPQAIYSLCVPGYHLNLSFPEPISFSDQLTDQQTFFFFQKIFSDYLTFEFYSLTETDKLQNGNQIFKTRWSFKDRNNNNQYVFHVFFLLKKFEKSQNKQSGKWKIIEIKAERI